MYWSLWEDKATNLQGPQMILEDQIDTYLELYPDTIIFEADLVPPRKPMDLDLAQEFLRVVKKYKDDGLGERDIANRLRVNVSQLRVATRDAKVRIRELLLDT